MHAALLAIVVGVASCHPTIGTVRFTAPGESRTLVNLEPDSTVRFWSDLDVSWSEEDDRPLAMTYEIALVQNGVVVGTSTCDPLRTQWHGMRACGKRMELGHTLVLNCLMHACELHVAQGGATEVRARWVVQSAPAGLSIRRANVLVSQ